MFSRISIFAYSVVSYVMFLGVFLYSIGFIGGFAVPTTLDGEVQMSFMAALAINLGLLSAFAVQHSVMARPAFKRWWTKIIPAAAERSTYVLLSNVCMIVLFLAWQPLPGEIWNIGNPAARNAVWGLYGLGWLTLLVATFLINHFDLFGLRQVWHNLRGTKLTPLPFQMKTAYRFVRHPIYVGWVIIFWAAPTMTLTRLIFAVVTTVYILVAIQLEERDLMEEHGKSYANYRSHVPMLIPALSARSVPEEAAAEAQPA